VIWQATKAGAPLRASASVERNLPNFLPSCQITNTNAREKERRLNCGRKWAPMPRPAQLVARRAKKCFALSARFSRVRAFISPTPAPKRASAKATTRRRPKHPHPSQKHPLPRRKRPPQARQKPRRRNLLETEVLRSGDEAGKTPAKTGITCGEAARYFVFGPNKAPAPVEIGVEAS